MGAFAPVERQVLVEMKELLRDDPVMTWWARYNPLLMREPQDEDPSEAQEPPTSPGLPMSPDLPSSSGMSPRHIAIALTKVEADNYERIRPADYISFLRGHPGLNNVEAANVINTKVEFWVKGAILVSKALRRRIEVLEFFIHTAEVSLTVALVPLVKHGIQECCQLRNFSSAGAIARALTSPLVQRLTLTRQGITRNSKRILARLNKLLDTSHDYEMYRSVLGESQANCIPWIGELLSFAS
jgi:son of sevenless-like protein